MSQSAPSDLAVAFRSFARRHREVHERAVEEGKEAEAAPYLSGLGATVAKAGALLGVSGTDLASMGAAIAADIESVDADDWTDERLEALQAIATEAGQQLRRAEDAIG